MSRINIYRGDSAKLDDVDEMRIEIGVKTMKKTVALLVLAWMAVVVIAAETTASGMSSLAML